MKYCPDCGTEYLNTAERCADCGTELVDEETWFLGLQQEESLREKLRDEDLESLCSVGGPVEARAILGALEQDEIPAVVRSYHETAFDGTFVHPAGWGEILVAKSRLEEAQTLLQALRDNPPKPLAEDEEPPSSDEVLESEE